MRRLHEGMTIGAAVGGGVLIRHDEQNIGLIGTGLGHVVLLFTQNMLQTPSADNCPHSNLFRFGEYLPKPRHTTQKEIVYPSACRRTPLLD